MSLRSVIRSAVGDSELPGRSSFYSLRGLFVCDGCDLRLAPLDLVDGGRGYRSACGCRIWPVNAEVVERLTRDAAEHRNHLQVADVPASELGPVFRRLLCEVRVGAVEHELTFLWRT